MCLRRMCILAAVEWNVLYMSVRFIGSIVLFKSSVSLIFCLDGLSTFESWLMRSIIVLLFASYIWVP